LADKTATIEFDEYPGKAFHVRLSPVSFDDYLDMVERVDGLSSLRSPEELREFVQRFADLAFVGWDGFEGEPTADNLRKQADFAVIWALVGNWIRAVRQVPLPLAQRSASGGPSGARKASRSRKSSSAQKSSTAS
jgi:hypothetical protein